jgi:DNA-binding CsgD family transcriptional regulator
MARGAVDTAQSILDELTASTRNLTDDALPSGLWRLRGSCALAARRHPEALATFEAAAEVAAREGRRPLLWQLYAGMAQAHQALGQHAAAAAARNHSQQYIDELAAAIPDPSLRSQFAGEAAGRLPPVATVTPRQAAKAQHGGLTTREREVAELIAQGLSNREIAARLVVAERTVAVHVGNILNKLGFSSRAQVARWVGERG